MAFRNAGDHVPTREPHSGSQPGPGGNPRAWTVRRITGTDRCIGINGHGIGRQNVARDAQQQVAWHKPKGGHKLVGQPIERDLVSAVGGIEATYMCWHGGRHGIGSNSTRETRLERICGSLSPGP